MTHDPARLALAAFDFVMAMLSVAFIIYAITSWNAKSREFRSKYPWL